MTLDAFKAALRSFTRRQPFQPFLIDFMSGDRVRVTHPEAVWLRDGLIIHRGPQRQYRLFDSDSVCQLLDVPPA